LPETEASPLGKEVLGQIIDNFEIAGRESVPMCEDTERLFVEVTEVSTARLRTR
jgi:fumarate hydratase subunit alpha